MSHTIGQGVPAHDLAGARITLVGINFPPEPTGIAPYNAAMADALAAAGATVTVVTGVPHYPMWRVQPPFGRVVRQAELRHDVTVKRRRHFVPRAPGIKGRAIMESTFFLHATPSVIRRKADAIIAVTPSLSGAGAAAAGSRGRPLGILVQDFTGIAVAQTEAAGSKVSGAIGALEKFVLRRADRLGVIASAFISDANALGFDDAHVSVLPNFTHVQATDAGRDEARQHLGWPTDQQLVVHTGNMGAKQGLRHVIEAARLAADGQPELRFMLVGAGNQEASLRAAADGLPNVTFVAPLSEVDYPYALAAADVLLLNEEVGVRQFCLPSKLTSYVIARRPILAAVEPTGLTAAEVERHGCAVVTPPGNPADLLAQITALLQDEGLQDALVAAASVQALEHDAPSAARRYVQFAADLLAGS